MKKYPKYFLAANSGEGFISYFSDCYNAEKGWKAYIIKGGPGTGKSTFMKTILSAGNKRGYEAEIFPCSSDPDSLDAVIFKELKIAILDGTSPHIVEPRYPGVCDNIINFGEFWDERYFENNKNKIFKVTNENKQYHKTASLFIKALGRIIENNYNLAFEFADFDKVKTFSEKLCQKYINAQTKNNDESIRFLSGITPKGVVTFTDTINDFYLNKVIIKDELGAVNHAIMTEIRKKCLEKGLEFITIKNHLIPNIIDNILIPELSLAFLRETRELKYDTETRRIHAKRFFDKNKLFGCKNRINLNNKLIKELTYSAVDSLKLAKESHDRLENYYISAMNYERLNRFVKVFENKIFK